jgi:hypothetical protein
MSPIYVPGKVTLKKESVAADPYYNNVSLLLHGDGANGSTTIVDSSPTPKTVTAFGDAQISTAQSKFGGSSIAFDGSGDYLTIPSQSAFNFETNDFTIEFWWRATAGSPGGLVDLGLNYGGIGIYQSTILRVRVAGLDKINVGLFSFNQWVHVALSRSSTSLRLFFDGIQQGATVSDSTDLSNSFANIVVGAFVSGGSYFATPAAYIDDLRITKGVARYISNFTPPTAPFPEVWG